MDTSNNIVKRQQRDFKKGVSQEDGRRRREENVCEIRKNKKEEGLSKRRNIREEVETEESGTTLLTIGPTTGSKKVFTAADIPSLRAGLQSPDITIQEESLRGFRRLLSLEKESPVRQCIDSGAVPLIVEFLLRHESTDLQFEAAWVLTNIASSSDETAIIVECGAIPHLVNLLLSPNADIREQCAWCLGNVAGDGPKLRDVVLSYHAIAPLIQNLQNPATISLLRNCTWSLSNMCRGKPQPDISILAPALPVLADILFQNRDIDTMVDATWALSYISDGEDMRIEAVLKTGVIPYLTNILRSDNVQAVVPSLRTLGNIVSGDDRQTQSVLDSNVLSALVPLLSHAKKNIRKETCWLLSNIAAGTVDQLTELVNTPSLLQRVLEQMSSTAEWDVRREACWVVSNVASVGQCAHIHNKLIEYGALTPLCELLTTADVKIVMVAMEALESILKLAAPDTLKRYIQLIDEAGGIDNLENLQEHADNKVYKKASQIIIKYFGGGDDEDESENIAPATTQNNGHTTFAFGIDPVKWQAPLNGSNSNGSNNNGGQKQFNNNNNNSFMNQQPSGFSFGN